MSDRPEWDCACTSEHRMTIVRAWCLDCSEWCYPENRCSGGEIPRLRAENERLKAELERVKDNTYGEREAWEMADAALKEAEK